MEFDLRNVKAKNLKKQKKALSRLKALFLLKKHFTFSLVQ